MIFNSFSYILFLPLVCIIYYALPHRFRWALLLGASYFFYCCWNVKYALLMFFSTAITYAAGLLIDRENRICGGVVGKRIWIVISSVLNLSVLFLFKYYSFMAETINVLMDKMGFAASCPSLSLILPVGISFYTLQSLGYTVDVYRGNISCQRHFGKYALFVSFFPQLVAGPIERSANIFPQFEEKHRFSPENARDGLFLIGLGMFEKIVIADRLAVFVDEVYNNLENYGGAAYMVATIFFTFQIYCDFGGYSNIAIGSARILGFRLMKNFDHPYLSGSIAEFWRRWHISLSTWFKDYLYIPLGGNRVSPMRWSLNIMTVFLVSGLWHGADWTFVLWGGLHGLFQVGGKYTRNFRASLVKCARIPFMEIVFKVFSIIVTFMLVAFAGAFFRVNSFDDVRIMIERIKEVGWARGDISDLIAIMDKRDFLLSICLVIGVYIFDAISEKIDIWEWLKRRILPIRWTVYMLGILTIILFGYYGQTATFIYFQF